MTTFYLTTPIYYPNGEPHLGHAYTTLCSDVICRYHRLAGDETFFLTGTDEHGIKMVKTASDKKITPAQLADQNVAVFESLWKELKITNDDFIRTTSDRHKKSVQAIVTKMVQNGDIYLGGYEGWYDESQEEFVTETEAKAHDYKSSISGRPLVRYNEPSYFFKLTKYAPMVQKYIEENPEFIRPESRRNEVLSKLKQGVEDLSISRATLKWGIPLPNDPAHVVYVWIDALSNYITAMGYGADDARLKKFWPCNVHMIGKEIMWFHTVYWPAMLMSIGMPLPKSVFAHGWWTADGKKMSKTLGNFVDIERLRAAIAKYGLDGLRYYLLRAAPFGSDLDWSDADLAKSHNELSNVLGNCLNRALKMIANSFGSVLPPIEGPLDDLDKQIIEKTKALAGEIAGAYDRLELQKCAMIPMELARAVNGYIDATAPFKLAKDPATLPRAKTVLHISAQAIYRVLAALLPILPEKAVAGLGQMNVKTEGMTIPQLLATDLPVGHQLQPPSPLFPRV